MRTTMMALVMAGLLAGCGGEEDEAKAKCFQFTDTLCNRAVGCFPGQVTFETCKQEAAVAVDCNQAESVDDGRFAICLQQVQTFQCSVLFPGGMGTALASCMSVFKR